MNEYILGRWLTEEELKKVEDVEVEQRTYAPTLAFEEQKLYKFTLQEEIREVEGDYGMSKVVEVLNHGDGQEYSLWLSVVLRHKFRDCKAEKGVTLGVVYKGIPKGKRYKDYAVFVWTDATTKMFGIEKDESCP